MDPPPDLQFQHGIAVPRHLEDGDAAEKDRAHVAMEAAYKRTAESLRLRPPRIPHAVAVMVMALAFHTEDPYRVGEDLNIFLFNNLSL